MDNQRRYKAYISGQIKNINNHIELFDEAEIFLQVCGYSVVSPVEVCFLLALDLGRDPTYQECMKADIKAMLNCDIVFMMKNWKRSKGARDEKRIAEIAGIEVRYLPK